MTNKWKTLFEEIEVIKSELGSEIWSQDEINKFEANTGIVLLVDYKDICYTFTPFNYS